MNEKETFFNKLFSSNENINTTIDTIKIGLYISKQELNSYYGQIMLEVSINLLSRIYSNIIISLPETKVNLLYCNSYVELKQHLFEIGTNAREGSKDNIIFSSDLSSCNAILSIGHYIYPQDIPIVFISANGWLAGISSISSISFNNLVDDKNPVGSIAASCLGIAEIFKITFAGKISKQVVKLNEQIIFSTLDYSVNKTNTQNPPLQSLNINNTVLFGAGSVGSSILYCMKYLREIHGILQIVDTDKEVESRNLLRYGYLNVSDLEKYKSVPKTLWAKEKMKLDCPFLEIEARVESVNDYICSNDPYHKIELAISAVDNIIARRDITELLARRTINAGTSDTKFTISRHGFNDGQACLYCNYMNISSPPSTKYQQYKEMTKLPMSRIYKLIEDNDTLNEDDINIMFNNNVIPLASKHLFIGKPLLSFIHERFYGEVQISNENTEKTITLAFVTVMAGCLLFGEMIKELTGLRTAYEGTMYEQDLLALPNEIIQKRNPNQSGLCLCQNAYRRLVYTEKYNQNIC